MKVTSLFEYPVKGLKANSLACASVNKRGLAMDRRWMLIDDEGTFLSQRVLPGFTQFEAVHDDNLKIRFLPTGEEMVVAIDSFSQKNNVSVWGQKFLAHGADNGINSWLSDHLNKSIRLVYMDHSDIRPLEESVGDDDIVSFADGYPVLLASESSLADLNGRLNEPVGMDRFRPNIVIDGNIPFEEDDWRTLKVGGVTFEMAKPCARCHVINIDQSTGLASKEPLKTLSTYREKNNKVFFAVNLVPRSEGIIHQGDEVVVLS